MHDTDSKAIWSNATKAVWKCSGMTVRENRERAGLTKTESNCPPGGIGGPANPDVCRTATPPVPSTRFVWPLHRRSHLA